MSTSTPSPIFFAATITTTAAASMATAPAPAPAPAPSIKLKSQPLHNFSLPHHLRWAHKNHHYPLSTTAPHLDSDTREPPPRKDDHVVISSPQMAAKPPPRSSSSRASRKLLCSTSSLSSSHHNQKAEKDDAVARDGVGEENNEVKPWNLRPRKVAALVPPSTSKLQDSKTMPSQKVSGNGNDGNRTSRPRGIAGEVGGFVSGHGSERQRKVVEEKKRKFWISLSKEEIEEDVYALTGSRPRKPKKRPRNVQKLLDNTFPALYLVGMTAESYRGHDTLR